MRTIQSIAACFSAFALFGLLLAAPAGAATSAEIISDVNAQREANDLPAGITERPDWSQSCAEHDAYMRQTAGVGHDEDPSLLGYTKAGAWAGNNSVLSDTGDWTITQNPFATAPIHLAQLLSPDLAEMGADQDLSTGYTCATTFPGYTRPAPAQVAGYSYPGDGATGVAASEVAAEAPFTPGEHVGLPAGTETGPYLMAFLNGPSKVDSATISAASLTGPDGPVAIERIGSDDRGIRDYLPGPMAFLIPRAPLASGTYMASVTFSYGRTSTLVSFSFTVGDQLGSDPASVGPGTVPGDGAFARLKLSAHPAKRTSDRSPTFAFSAAGASGFECRFDDARWKSCTTPITYRRIATGRHRFCARATGVTGPVRASFSFRIS